ncbi:hypothetical protein Pdw03_7940 [Penicillium digitatum]|uniref:Uncharacterized protein n=1 Tax=Penicillium digitatum TaxID=36651 RepID=A0A7T6XMS5_PENDI|nr:hypothetical protein Pdw03_7940 [Penicillium digitatum]
MTGGGAVTYVGGQANVVLLKEVGPITFLRLNRLKLLQNLLKSPSATPYSIFQFTSNDSRFLVSPRC